MATHSRQLTPEEHIEAVSRVAAHVPVAVVADQLGVSPEVVVSAVNRAKASREARGATHVVRAEATPRVRNGQGTDVPPSPAPKPAAAEPTSADLADLFTVEELVKWADDAGVNRAVMLAERIRVSSDELRAMVRRREEIAARKAKVANAEELLAKARAELAEVTGSQRPAPRDGSTTSTIRAWALANGHEVQPRGLLPHSVIAAYHAAHRGGTP